VVDVTAAVQIGECTSASAREPYNGLIDDVRVYTRALTASDITELSGTLPGQATSPNPSDGATGVALNPTLSWTAGSLATSHDVYFGTISPGTPRGNQPGTTYNPPECPLTASSTYFWRIDEKNGAGTTTGVVWSFTTGTGIPLAHYTFNGNANNSGSGGAPLNGTLEGGARLVDNVLVMDGGPTSAVNCTNNALWNGITSSLSIAAWIKPDLAAMPLGWERIVSKGAEGGVNGYSWILQRNGSSDQKDSSQY
jgi:hypothetical protein